MWAHTAWSLSCAYTRSPGLCSINCLHILSSFLSGYPVSSFQPDLLSSNRGLDCQKAGVAHPARHQVRMLGEVAAPGRCRNVWRLFTRRIQGCLILAAISSFDVSILQVLWCWWSYWSYQVFQACLLKDHDYLQYCKADVLEKKGFPRTQTKFGIRERERQSERDCRHCRLALPCFQERQSFAGCICFRGSWNCCARWNSLPPAKWTNMTLQFSMMWLWYWLQDPSAGGCKDIGGPDEHSESVVVVWSPEIPGVDYLDPNSQSE